MNLLRSLSKRLAALATLIAIMAFAFSEKGESFKGYMDYKAGLLVFLAPILVSILFQIQGLSIRNIFRRMKEVRNLRNEKLVDVLTERSTAALGRHRSSALSKMTEQYNDSYLSYATGLWSGRYSEAELSRLLSQQADSEDHLWHSVAQYFGFLAKMAPYFGMFATVVGMVKLLGNLTDFARISGSMALAMQGTLYGLISFTMVYSPLQRFFSGYRELILKRNEIIARWILSITKQSDEVLIREELKSLQTVSILHDDPQNFEVVSAPDLRPA